MANLPLRERDQMLQNFLTNYEVEYDSRTVVDICDKDCGFGTSCTFRSQEEFWIHIFSHHRPCAICADCGAILDAGTLDYHLDFNCNDAEAGKEYRKVAIYPK